MTDRMEIMQVIFVEMGCDMNGVVEEKENREGMNWAAAGTVWGKQTTK